MSNGNPKKKRFICNETVASTPGGIRFDPFVWIKYNRAAAYLSAGSVILFLIISYYYMAFLFAAVVFAYKTWIFWTYSAELFTADSNAGLIISVKPPLAAVATNLANAGGDYPVIKVIEYKVKRRVRIGDRIGTIGLYEQSDDENSVYWSDFFPIPIEYATEDRQQISAELQRYPGSQWEAIRRGVSQLDKPYKTGLYRMDQLDSDWNYV